MIRSAFTLFALALAAPIVAHEFRLGGLTIDHPWARETAKGQIVGGGFMTITNKGPADDRLIAATSPAAAEVQLHSMTMNNGVMQMRQIRDGIAIPRGETVTLQPGGLHVMFMGLKQPLARGTKIPVTLRFARSGTVKVGFAIEAAGTMSKEKSGHAGH